MPTMGSPRPNSSVPRLPLSFDISSGKHIQALLFGPITEVILEGTTSNHSCLLTQGPSDHPGAGLGSHLEERALVLVVQCGQLSWLLSDQRGSPHYGAKRLTVDRQGISGCRVPPPTPAMWHRYLLPWEGSDLSVGEHFWQSLHRDSLCLCKHVRVCVCARTSVHEAVRVKDKDNMNALKRHFFIRMLENTRCRKTSDHRNEFHGYTFFLAILIQHSCTTSESGACSITVFIMKTFTERK